MKKTFAFLLAAFLLLTFCAAAENAPLMGGWTPSASPEITKDIQKLVDEALEGLVGVSYMPVAYLGSQIVAGTNHCILCQASAVYPDAQPYYALLYIYQDLQGKATILTIAPLDIGALCDYGAGLE